MRAVAAGAAARAPAGTVGRPRDRESTARARGKQVKVAGGQVGSIR